MKYCQKCGCEIHDDAVVCINCGCQVGEIKKSEGKAMGICAIIFGALGGWLGLLFGIIGLCIYKEPVNRRNCGIGLGLFGLWCLIYIIIKIV